jgi:hypothetical protein
MKTVTELLLLTKYVNYNTTSEHDNTSTFRFRPDEKQGGTPLFVPLLPYPSHSKSTR